MRPRDYPPRPVYVVNTPPPDERRGLSAGGVLLAIPVLILLVALVGPALRDRAATASGQPGADPRTAAAGQAALERQDQRIEDKGRECDTLEGDAWQRCMDEWRALNDQRAELAGCVADAVNIAAVADCERRAGIR